MELYFSDQNDLEVNLDGAVYLSAEKNGEISRICIDEKRWRKIVKKADKYFKLHKKYMKVVAKRDKIHARLEA